MACLWEPHPSVWLIKSLSSVPRQFHPAHLWKATEKKLTHPRPAVLAKPGKTTGPFTLLPHRLLALFYKRNWHLDPIRFLYVWYPSLPSYQSDGFPNKVAIPSLNPSSPNLLACCVVSRVSLDSVTSKDINYLISEVKKSPDLDNSHVK